MWTKSLRDKLQRVDSLSVMKPMLPWLLILFLVAGCATAPHGNWNERVGNYTFQQAVNEMGAPQDLRKAPDGTFTAQWRVRPGEPWTDAEAIDADFYSPSLGINPVPFGIKGAPDRFIRLTFGLDGRLLKWKRLYA